jgi:hypothetical protein
MQKKMARRRSDQGQAPSHLVHSPSPCEILQTFLNSKLFLHKPIVNVEEFSPWMMPRDPVPVVLDPEPVVPDPVVVPPPPPPPKKSVDGLFWCIYHLHHGRYPQDKNEEMQEKINVVKWAWENRSSILAQSRLSATKLQEYTAEIMSSSKKTTWGALYLECLFYKINVRILHEDRPIYMDFLGTDDNEEQAPQKIQDKTYSLVHSAAVDEEDRLAVDFRQPAPLKGQGNYKVDDLKALAKKLGLAAPPHAKKKDWYDAVYKALAW